MRSKEIHAYIRPQMPEGFVAVHVEVRKVETLQIRAAGTQCSRCLKAFIAEQWADRNADVLQTLAAGTRRTPCLKATPQATWQSANIRCCNPWPLALNAHNA